MAETGAIIHGEREVRRNFRAVRSAVENHMFAAAIEGACRLVVNEVKSSLRPLAWNDVTGNLRASISFQVEHHIGPKAVFGHNQDGGRVAINSEKYYSGAAAGTEMAVVFAPPDYAIHVEAKSTRSVLLVPLATVRAKLRKEMSEDGRAVWKKFVIARRAIGTVT